LTTAAFRAEKDLVFRLLHHFHGDLGQTVTGGQKGRLVDQVGQVGAAHPGCSSCQDSQIHVVRQRDLPRVDLEDALSAPDVGQVDDDAAVETSGPQQRRVEHVGAVGRRQQNDAVVALESVHFDEQLVESLLALVVSAAQPRATVTPDGVDLVYEKDARRVLLTLIEQVANAGGAHTHEHLHEVRPAHREERHIRLSGHRACKQRLARPRGAQQDRSLGDPAAQPLKLLGVAQKLDDLLQFLLGLIRPGHVVERHFRPVSAE
jgi:hypothetical protein